MIADEVQTGLGRTGKMLTIDWENVKADIVCLGKSLSGGYMPISAILGNNSVMNVWDFGDMQSTYAGNPLACEIAKTAVDVLIDEEMIQNAEKLGKILDEELKKIHYPFVKDIQSGKGLFGAIEMTDMLAAWTVAKMMIDKGVLIKPEVGARLKFMPPICISEVDLRYVIAVLKESLVEYDKKGKLNLIA
jgi:ornithine--oxo-acid transaminase